jgi:adenine-specific DNA-methyltransferase
MGRGTKPIKFYLNNSPEWMLKMILNPHQALNKAFLKVKPARINFDNFKEKLINMICHINPKESEEFHKNLLKSFLEKTAFNQNYFINTQSRIDLAIHQGKTAKDNIGVIIEAKSPTNNQEMPNVNNINSKALQELVLYYLRERITNKNLEIKNLIITNLHQWFIFDAAIFDKHFAQNKKLVAQFIDFEQKNLAITSTEDFYKLIASAYIEEAKATLEFTHFSLDDYKKLLTNNNTESKKLIHLYKLLSAEHLLKLPFANDNNSLNNVFYSELLHLIGLEETKNGSKKVIQRKIDGQRHAASLLESTITQLDTLDKLRKLKNKKQYGETSQEQLFNVALELVITWINRILFLKLLEAQLLNYHKGNKDYAFLNSQKIKSFDDLNALFFRVLAKKSHDRDAKIQTLFSTVPYLNSSLFELTELEDSCFTISQLAEDTLPVLNQTILKDTNGKRVNAPLDILVYLFDFLNAYDFSSEGTGDIEENNKTLISASVLGLIFEKINGYKDGSFFTPSFITMYMCKQTLRQAVLQKFNDVKKWHCTNFDDLYNQITDKKEANDIINSLKLCDPAVGSGHFLVSALNELILIKHDLKVLIDKNGKTFRDYDISLVNDELIITDDDGGIFEYKPKNTESQRLQETLFHEKQTLIENCLFGVDINPNSVKICRLRLWIELLKNAYYANKGTYIELETLPNIDINIKCGNSLISRFNLDTDLSKALKKQKITITQYQEAVKSYRHAKSKDEKWHMVELIDKIKSGFTTEISGLDTIDLNNKKGALDRLQQQQSLFEETKEAKKDRLAKLKKAQADYDKLFNKVEDLKSNQIYENAFEWRFEFPEILDDKGNFVGFDVVIGNPPYGMIIEDKKQKKHFIDNFISSEGKHEIYKYFIEFSFSILCNKGLMTFITPDTWLQLGYFNKLREYIFSKFNFISTTNTLYAVFEEATVDVVIFTIKKASGQHQKVILHDSSFCVIGEITPIKNILYTKNVPTLITKIESQSNLTLNDFTEIWQGLIAYGEKTQARIWTSNAKDSQHHRKLLYGGDKPQLVRES